MPDRVEVDEGEQDDDGGQGEAGSTDAGGLMDELAQEATRAVLRKITSLAASASSAAEIAVLAEGLEPLLRCIW